ncbi:MAG TPA: hypothetical protein VH436_11905 [Vicinamibacterales bacterium]|jgi:hypothetical protein
MRPLEGEWERLGRILSPDPAREWMATFVGPSFALARTDSNAIDIHVTGRDLQNRSRIGVMTFDLENSRPLDITPEPVFDLGTRGAFDENGVSYPWIVDADGTLFMYYVGWMPTVLTPFQNHIGLAARRPGDGWQRVSRAPILERTNEEFLSLGSVSVLREGARWRMWYTCFREWGSKPGDPKHVYVIKYAESTDGIAWHRPGIVCIDTQSPAEYSIGRPSVLHLDGMYHMWFSYRGDAYRIGYAVSQDGIEWRRCDHRAGLDPGVDAWERDSVCYSHVFIWRRALYMLYCGNHYGRDGLGLARFRSAS